MLFDTHTHLCDERFDSDREQVIAELKPNGIGKIIEVSDAVEYSQKAVALANNHKNIYAAVGVHPYEAKTFEQQDCNILGDLAQSNEKVIAIGEIGLDYHAEHIEYKDVQKQAFQWQLDLAKSLNLPIIVHIRDAYEDAYAILRESGITTGIIHCFSGNREQAQTALDLGFHIAFGGAMTYTSAEQIRAAAQIVPDERLLIETDCPYLVPKGVNKVKRNEPKYILKAAILLAEIRGTTLAHIEDITYQNACTLFNITA